MDMYGSNHNLIIFIIADMVGIFRHRIKGKTTIYLGSFQTSAILAGAKRRHVLCLLRASVGEITPTLKLVQLETCQSAAVRSFEFEGPIIAFRTAR
jgi:hypothetical protein